MKKSHRERLEDPYFLGLLHNIETLVCVYDDQAKEEGIALNDSHIKSALIRARKLVEGSDPKVPDETTRDQILQGLTMAIYHAPDAITMEEVSRAKDSPAPDVEQEDTLIEDWILALKVVEDSIKNHQLPVPGSRGYLDFIRAQMEPLR